MGFSTALVSMLYQISDTAPAREVGETTSPSAGSASGGGLDWSFILVIIAMVGVFWFLVIRPQRKQQKDLRRKIEGVRKGDHILTSAGFHMRVVAIREHSVVAEMGEDRDSRIKTEVGKNYIHNVFSKDLPEEIKPSQKDDVEKDD